jgi:hypothetical protein
VRPPHLIRASQAHESATREIEELTTLGVGRFEAVL